MNNADRMALAGDYVLGLLDEAACEQVEREMQADPALRDAVLAAQQHFHRLDLTAVPDPVPEHMWEKVSTRIADAAQPSLSGAVPVKLRPAANSAAGRGLHSLGGWRGLAVAASIAAACAIGYFGALATTQAPQPVVVVVLDTDANVPGAIFEAYADDSVRIIPLEDFEVPEGQTMQVWTLYDQAVGPVSLGTIGRNATEIKLQGPHLPTPKADQLYEITLEPAPGSPTGKPTGPILVKGFAKRPAGT
jgi:anti-sigma-K factor RskA